VTVAYLGLGSNLGDRLGNLRLAVASLRERVEVAAVSQVYETEPVGYMDQGWFLNAVAAVETSDTAEGLFSILQDVEARMGKATPFRDGPRLIDIDLLLCGDLVLDSPGLQVPHPRLHQRRFVLTPLAEIAPDAVHPVLNASIARLLDQLPVGEQVRAYAPAGLDWAG
jgi:2-amino-4-hydroxy-6-hydroxymethyldihydropteridine diphosphokinase